jgi:signal transduction histidine kinase
MRNSFKRGMPPWSPPGEAWASPSHPYTIIRRRRTWFFRRVAFGLVVLALLMTLSLLAAVWLITPRTGAGDGAAALGALVLLFVAVAVVLLLVRSMRRIGSPLHAVMDAADRVADGDYGVRVQEHGPPPMRALAHSFNTMTERLQNADRVRRNVMADVAHELRTPLSVVQGRLEGLIDGVYPRDDRQLGELLEETRVLSRLIEDLRTLALSDAGALPLQKEETDLVDLVRDVVQSMTPEADTQSISLTTSASVPTATADVDPVRVREVLTNIVLNALRHGTGGSSVTVTVSQTNENIAVAVRDTGQGMSPQELARAFDRFYKGTGSRGSGLGLAIAKSIVTAHGGEIRASSEPGKGAIVEFTLPKFHRAIG